MIVGQTIENQILSKRVYIRCTLIGCLAVDCIFVDCSMKNVQTQRSLVHVAKHGRFLMYGVYQNHPQLALPETHGLYLAMLPRFYILSAMLQADRSTSTHFGADELPNTRPFSRN